MNKQQAVASRRLIRRDAALSIDQVRQILSPLGYNPKELRLRILVSLIATTGIRQKELCEARWCDVDFNQRSICVHSNYQERKVPFGPRVLNLLQSQRDQDPGSQYVLGCSPKAVINRLCKTSLRYDDLRHFFLSHWVTLGGDPESLMTVAGYSCPVTRVHSMGSPEQAFKIAASHQVKIENELFKLSDFDQSEVSA
jgi:integrase